jgi:hypothetical protein
MSTVAAILEVIDEHGFEDTSETNKLFWLNETYADVIGREPWPFLEAAITFTWSGSSAIPTNFPANFRSVDSIVDTRYPRELQPRRWKEIYDRFGANLTEVNDPLFYYFLADELRVWPVPPASNTTVVMTYLRDWTALTAAGAEATILIPPKYHPILVHGTLKHLYLQDDDPELAASASNVFESKILQMRNDLWMRQWDRPVTIEDVDPEYYS